MSAPGKVSWWMRQDDQTKYLVAAVVVAVLAAAFVAHSVYGFMEVDPSLRSAYEACDDAPGRFLPYSEVDVEQAAGNRYVVSFPATDGSGDHFECSAGQRWSDDEWVVTEGLHREGS